MALTNEGGIFAIINGIIEGLPEVAGKVGGKVMNFANDVADFAIDGAKSTFASVSSVSLGNSFTPEPSVAQGRAPEIAAPARGIHDVDVAELGGFPPPTFSVAARDTAVGLG